MAIPIVSMRPRALPRATQSGGAAAGLAGAAQDILAIQARKKDAERQEQAAELAFTRQKELEGLRAELQGELAEDERDFEARFRATPMQQHFLDTSLTRLRHQLGMETLDTRLEFEGEQAAQDRDLRERQGLQSFNLGLGNLALRGREVRSREAAALAGGDDFSGLAQDALEQFGPEGLADPDTRRSLENLARFSRTGVFGPGALIPPSENPTNRSGRSRTPPVSRGGSEGATGPEGLSSEAPQGRSVFDPVEMGDLFEGFDPGDIAGLGLEENAETLKMLPPRDQEEFIQGIEAIDPEQAEELRRIMRQGRDQPSMFEGATGGSLLIP